MLKTGIYNPALLDLIARIRHTNLVVIADAAFPFWPHIETVDISLIAGVPTVAQVVDALRANHHVGRAYAAEEFLKVNPRKVTDALRKRLAGVELNFEPHVQFKLRVPGAIGLIRTGDTIPYANLILESA
jgi:D-ribose pyranase